MKRGFLCLAKTLVSHIFTVRNFFIVFIITLLVLAFADYDMFFVYPEENYQFLEAEANRMISSNDFNTEYELELKYNNQSNSIEFQLDGYSIYVRANVNNYGESNQDITIQRKSTNISYLPHNILFLITVSIFITALFSMLGLLAMYIIEFFENIKEHFAKK